MSRTGQEILSQKVAPLPIGFRDQRLPINIQKIEQKYTNLNFDFLVDGVLNFIQLNFLIKAGTHFPLSCAQHLKWQNCGVLHVPGHHLAIRNKLPHVRMHIIANFLNNIWIFGCVILLISTINSNVARRTKMNLK